MIKTQQTNHPPAHTVILPTNIATDQPHFVRPPFLQRISNKFLLLTILAVLVAEILIFVPSIAGMRMRWLSARLDSVIPVSIILSANEAMTVPRKMQDDILLATGTKAIILREAGSSRPLARLLPTSELPELIDQQINLDHTSEAQAIWDAFGTLFNGGNRNLRVYRPVGDAGQILEIIIADAPLRQAMLIYARNVALISLLISLLAAGFIYLIINEMLLRPVIRMHRNMIGFAQSPDDPTRIMIPDDRNDELGVAQRQLSHIQTHLQRTFTERKHLADLGLAVSKINHDMRNILASAQLISDSLADIQDPSVKRFAPKLIRTLSRAIQYSESVIAYGRAQEAPPKMRRALLHPIVADVGEGLDFDQQKGYEFQNLVPADFELDVDTEQFFRVLTNLFQNALQAMQSEPEGDGILIKRLTVSAFRQDAIVIIDVEDTGPGLSQQARDNIFTAFRGSTRSDGTGLGLAITQELVRAHGGDIELQETHSCGAHFRISLPDRLTPTGPHQAKAFSMQAESE